MKESREINKQKISFAKLKKKHLYLAVFVGLAVVSIFITFSVIWGKAKLRKAQAIQQAISNPENIDPEKLLSQIDGDFLAMTKEDKQKILENPKKLENYVKNATFKELSNSFSLLFKLPKPIRKRVIKSSAEHLRKRAEVVGSETIDGFFESDVGKGALRGASKYFFLELNGKQKVEVAELTDAMAQIVRARVERKRRGLK